MSWSYTKLKSTTQKQCGLGFYAASLIVQLCTTSVVFPYFSGSAGLDVLQVVIALMLLVNGLYWFFSNIEDVWEKLIGVAFLSVATGTPILFTSLTRSVFEVSKLFNLRFALLWIMVVLALRAIITKEKLQFIKTSITWPIIAFSLVTILSAVLCENGYIALLGAYDRWDGLLTELQYMAFIWLFIQLVKDKHTIFWLLGSLLIGALASGLYGMSQGGGIDFMNWSVNPTARVFGCINNPVHYSPYILMHVPLLIGFIFYLMDVMKEQNAVWQLNVDSMKSFFVRNKFMLLMYGMMASVFVLYFVSGYLSFGRATWIGGSMAISLILWFMYLKDTRSIMFQFVFMLAGFAAINAFWVFKIWMAAWYFWIPIVLALGAMLSLAIAAKERKPYILYTLLVVYGGILQFCMVDIWHLLLNIVIAGLVVYYFADERKLHQTVKVFILFMMIVSIAIPSWEVISLSMMPVDQRTTKLQGTDLNIVNKATSYATAFENGTARTSMWKTGIEMWKSSPLFGIGPGMIKEAYPEFRRADYGRLEGGHNYTPDQLHNDYVNMLATRGVLGVITYFLWLIPLGIYLMLKKIKNEGMKPANYILAGLLAGTFVYSGQILFNFGVVATRVLFYELFALALCIVIHDPFKTSNSEG